MDETVYCVPDCEVWPTNTGMDTDSILCLPHDLDVPSFKVSDESGCPCNSQDIRSIPKGMQYHLIETTCPVHHDRRVYIVHVHH